MSEQGDFIGREEKEWREDKGEKKNGGKKNGGSTSFGIILIRVSYFKLRLKIILKKHGRPNISLPHGTTSNEVHLNTSNKNYS